MNLVVKIKTSERMKDKTRTNLTVLQKINEKEKKK